jgi:hypothetical protein
MTGKYHAYILELDGALKVRPAVASVDSELSGDEPAAASFTIRNLTDHTATLRLKPPMPPPRHGPTPPAHVSPLPPPVVIEPGRVGVIPLPTGASGLYRYEVTFDLAGGGVVHAAAESDPVVIVDP